jgi:hypothetical protein
MVKVASFDWIGWMGEQIGVPRSVVIRVIRVLPWMACLSQPPARPLVEAQTENARRRGALSVIAVCVSPEIAALTLNPRGPIMSYRLGSP